jgi:hypothetical protein
MFKHVFKEGRNWAVVIGNSYIHQTTGDGSPEHMLPILKKAQIEAMKEGDGKYQQVAVEQDYILIELFEEYTSDLMEVYIHDWIYMLDPEGDIRYAKCDGKEAITLQFEDFKDGI